MISIGGNTTSPRTPLARESGAQACELRSSPNRLHRGTVPAWDMNLVLDVRPAADQTAALELWRGLECRFAAGSGPGCVPLTASHLWTSAWLSAYGDIVPHEFMFLRNADGPVGAALLTRGIGRRIGPFRVHTRHVGTAGEDPREGACVEYNDLLVLSPLKPQLQEHLLAYVLRDKSWGTFCLDGFVPEALHGFQQDLPGFELQTRESPYYDLDATRNNGGDLFEPLGRSTRQNLRRLLRKYGETDCEWAEDLAQAHDIFAELKELHQARWQAAGQPGAFHSHRFQAFQQRLIDAAFALPPSERPVVLFRARSQGETVGCLMLLVDRGRLLDYLSGLADFQKFASPGLVTHALCMQQALARDFHAYDFLVGEKRHKANLSTHVNRLVWATWTRNTLPSRTLGILRSLKRRWQQFRAQRPAAGDAAPAT